MAPRCAALQPKRWPGCMPSAVLTGAKLSAVDSISKQPGPWRANSSGNLLLSGVITSAALGQQPSAFSSRALSAGTSRGASL